MAAALAMAGLAEAAEQMALLVAWGGLLLAAVFLAAGIWRRTWALFGLGVGAWLVLTMLFTPWAAFGPIDNPHGDPDVDHWVSQWRGWAAAWVAVTVGAIVAGAMHRRGAPR